MRLLSFSSGGSKCRALKRHQETPTLFPNSVQEAWGPHAYGREQGGDPQRAGSSG